MQCNDSIVLCSASLAAIMMAFVAVVLLVLTLLVAAVLAADLSEYFDNFWGALCLTYQNTCNLLLQRLQWYFLAYL